MTTAHNCLYILAAVFAVIGWGMLAYAEDDVTVVSTAAAATTPTQTVAPDGTPVVHKSLHKKKSAATATASASGATTNAVPPVTSASLASTANKQPVTKLATTDVATTARPQPASATTPAQAPATATTTARTQSVVPTNMAPATSTKSAPVSNTAAAVPTVETGLPVARYPGVGAPIKGVSTYVPTTVTPPAAKPATGTVQHQQPFFASTYRSSVVPLASSATTGSYSTPSRTAKPSSDFVFTNYSKKPKTTNYPWKTNIITTMFWIGEGGSNVSSTDNIASAWDANWRTTNRGNDNPYNRNGYAPADHAPTVNTFYVALPFNDLVFPDKAREWVPRAWYRPPQDGKQVSACKDRWVEIKNAQGRSCFAQWEDVGPLRYDHAEYVFGNERPIGVGDDHAGLDVSPAVAQYLGIDGKNRITSWRFVDEEDVLPGQWLRYDELALLYKAMHEQKSSSPSSDLPIQRATEPINEPDSNKKKVDASKG